MTTQELFDRAKTHGCQFEASCVGITSRQWDKLMEGHTRANRQLAARIAHMAGVIDEEDLANELKRPGYNPYNHYKTKTHIVYVNSSIEHFIKIL